MSRKWLPSHLGVTLLAKLLAGVEVRVAKAADGVIIVGCRWNLMSAPGAMLLRFSVKE